MAERATWTGTIRFAGLVPIHVSAYAPVKSRRSVSFKTLDPKLKRPVQQVYLDEKGKKVVRADTLKGVENGADNWVALGDDALELIEKATRSSVVEIERFAPAASVDTSLAIETYRLTPNEKVPESEEAVQLLWNGLRSTGRVAVVEDWTARAGSKPSTLVVSADDAGLVGYLMPFEGEVKSLPLWKPVENESQAVLFEQIIEQNYELGEFNLGQYRDVYSQRRQAAIDMALSGAPAPKEVTEAAEVQVSTPDLMSVLRASLKDVDKPKTKKRAPSKAKAKVAA